MKQFLLGTAILAVLTAAAHAADMPVKAPPPTPVSYTWTGAYIGAYFGESIGSAELRTPSLTSGIADLNQAGFTAGGTVGFNWQFDPRFLIGLEADFGTAGLHRSVFQWNDFAQLQEKADWYGTVRARFGYVTGPSLIYVTGGGVVMHIRDDFGGTATAGPTQNSEDRTGWTAGGGIETKLSRSWSAKTEYLYMHVGSSTFFSNVFGGPFVTVFDHNFHVIKTGLNYKLGEPFLDGLPLAGTSPMLPSNHNWSGFYLGANISGGISNVRSIGGGGTLGKNSEEGVNGTGSGGGALAGYNYVLGKTVLGTWFVGVEADYDYLGVKGSQRDWNDFVRFADKTTWYGTARVRVGTSTGPALLYFTGGGAWVHLTDTFALIGATSQATRTEGGWTFGGGTEVALDPRWSARIESLYIDAGHNNLAVGAAHGDFKDRFTVVRVGVSAKIN